MMKKLAAMLLTGVMALSLAACGGSTGAATNTDSAEATATEEAAPAAEASDDTTFVVGFDAEYPPYGYLDEATGDYTGFDLEMAEELCKRRGWTLVKQPINWDNKDAELDSGSIDCIWNGMTCTGPDRENAYTWSRPYVNNSIVVAVSCRATLLRKPLLRAKSWQPSQEHSRTFREIPATTHASRTFSPALWTQLR